MHIAETLSLMFNAFKSASLAVGKMVKIPLQPMSQSTSHTEWIESKKDLGLDYAVATLIVTSPGRIFGSKQPHLCSLFMPNSLTKSNF